ncbi:DUF6538 domain-containing protein [Undibacterium sp. Xuan67W]|uniref:DUF6538 domain-containing protein n=1 Tax=Undibacterium sp. Xuan67W TaxID=3413057 RepID=UPI003BF220DB
MGIRLPSNLHRTRHGVLYFRLNIPEDLHDFFETKVIYRSLLTSSIRLASSTDIACRRDTIIYGIGDVIVRVVRPRGGFLINNLIYILILN